MTDAVLIFTFGPVQSFIAGDGWRGLLPNNGGN